MKTETIEIVERGRGPQLSTSRITVQDLLPYFQDGCSHEEIIRWMPTLTVEEIEAVERYYRDNQAELDEQDKKIRAQVAEQIRQQRLRFPEEAHEARLARMKETLRRCRQERTGEGNSG